MKSNTQPAQRLKDFNKPTIWTIMTPLAEQTKSINLGQGFPTWQPPAFFKKNYKKSIPDSTHSSIKAIISTAVRMDRCNTSRQQLNFINLLLDKSTQLMKFVLSMVGLRDYTHQFQVQLIQEKKSSFLILPMIFIVLMFSQQEVKVSEFL